MKVLPEHVRRQRAAQATLEQFRDRAFKLGTRDCVRLAAAHLRRLGYQVKLPASGSYCSVRAAAKKLEERGFADLLEAVDAHGLERIAPAAAVVGDVLAMPAEGPFGCGLVVALGNGRVVGYHQDLTGAGVLQPTEYITAWRARPR
jgi:hypothetical protein